MVTVEFILLRIVNFLQVMHLYEVAFNGGTVTEIP